MVEITGEHEYVASRKEQDREREKERNRLNFVEDF